MRKVDLPYRAWMRTQPCHWQGRLCKNVAPPWQDARACHYRGRRTNPDRGNLFPACDFHHGEFHRLGWQSFERQFCWGTTLDDISVGYTERYDEENHEPA